MSDRGVTSYAVGILYMGGWSDERGGVREHIGEIKHLYGDQLPRCDRMAFVRTRCGRQGKIVYSRIRNAQGVDDWVDEIQSYRICLTCKRSWGPFSDFR